MGCFPSRSLPPEVASVLLLAEGHFPPSRGQEGTLGVVSGLPYVVEKERPGPDFIHQALNVNTNLVHDLQVLGITATEGRGRSHVGTNLRQRE